MLPFNVTFKWKLQSSTLLCYCLTCERTWFNLLSLLMKFLRSVKAPSKYRKAKVELFINYAVLCITVHVFEVS